MVIKVSIAQYEPISKGTPSILIPKLVPYWYSPKSSPVVIPSHSENIPVAKNSKKAPHLLLLFMG